jgi:lipoprotein-anchoring transpeptidase ErfK/SrfK
MAVNGSAGDRRRRTRLLAAIAVLVPVVPIAIGIALTSGGGSGAPSPGTTYTPVSEPRTSGSQLTRARQLRSPIPPGAGALVAQIVKPTAMLSSPGGHQLARAGLRTEFGSPDFVLVARVSGPWLGVVSMLAGNNRLGWIPLSATTLSRVAYEIKVSLSARRLTVLDAGRVVQRYTIAVGRPTAPTPTGRFAVTDRLATGDPTGPYGCCILALSAVSPHAIQGWTGGNRIAIHSTPDTSSIGLPVSHGCMRLTLAEGRWLMYHIPLGTPTVISG